MPGYKSFKDLDCWQKCREVRCWTHQFLNEVVPKNDFDLRQNLRRASRSTTRNIAEGFGRFHHKENVHFCRFSKGSLYEIKDDLHICIDESIATEKQVKEGFVLVETALKSLNGYITYLNSKKSN